MCMKNVNINTVTFRSPNDGFPSIQVFDRAHSELDSDGLVIRDFNILLILSAIVSDEAENSNNCIVKDNEYEVRVRINHMKTNKGVDIASFSFDTNESSINKVCKPILEKKMIVTVPELSLPYGNGRYAIKVFIKNKKDSDWYIQSIQTFIIRPNDE